MEITPQNGSERIEKSGPSPQAEAAAVVTSTSAPPSEPPASPWWSQLRYRLLVLVMMAIVPAVLLVLYLAFQQRQAAFTESQTDNLRVARVAANIQKEHIEAARQLLLTLAQLRQLRREEAVACEELFTNLLPLHKVYANIGAIDPAGQLFASGLALTNVVNLGDEPFFRRAREGSRFVVGGYQMDRLTGKPTVNMAYPVRRKQGEVVAVVYAAVDLSWFTPFAGRSDLKEGATLTVVNRRGELLVRYPDAGKQRIHRSLAEEPGFEKILTSKTEGSGRARGLDGVDRLYAFTPLSRPGSVPDAWVIVGIPAKTAFASTRLMLVANLFFLAFVSVAALAAAWYGGDFFVVRQVKTLVAATLKLGKGELRTRTGLKYSAGELGQLARAFDHMADSIEQQWIQRQRAESDLKALNEGLEQRVADRTLELRRSNEELEQFAYVASHDLQEPLRMITNYLQLLRQRYEGRLDSNAQEFIGFAVDGAVRMQRLIADLLAYSRVGTQRNVFEATSAEDVLRRALANLTVAINEGGAQVTNDPLPSVQGDGGQLVQLFQNLIANGIKFHGASPARIHVRAERRGADWEFSVRDNGIGIAEQDFGRIFVIFQRLHGREKYPGTGIGLSVCKKIVERHGGIIRVESTPGQGTTFIFTLPAADSEAGAGS